ncbi:putative zinc transporter [Paratrimastix pyriformis]|uniref:Zinc transporter n=1 Tax=Paratrimastix pyriformis TaxID=342808 RepID=A0ABQ8UPB4_9EUKA|nr:putative zinc transporter [Paratrimastix pyriformis]
MSTTSTGLEIWQAALWICGSSVLMACVGLIGGVTLCMSPPKLRALSKGLVAFAAGSMIGGAIFHLIPEAVELVDEKLVSPLIGVGFMFFYAMEILIHRGIEWYETRKAGKIQCRACELQTMRTGESESRHQDEHDQCPDCTPESPCDAASAANPLTLVEGPFHGHDEETCACAMHDGRVLEESKEPRPKSPLSPPSLNHLTEMTDDTTQPSPRPAEPSSKSTSPAPLAVAAEPAPPAGDSHHRHLSTSSAWLNIIGDCLHNCLDGLSVGSMFLVDWRTGLITWLVAVFHEVPQEFGDFGLLIHVGWSPKKALLWNFFAQCFFIVGGLLSLAISGAVDVNFFLCISAGNFLFMGASLLLPEIRETKTFKHDWVMWFIVLCGGALLYVARIAFAGYEP